jgi:SPP1 family predicted phage head-tail adaptor
MNAGKLNRRITLNAPGQLISDGIGGNIEGDKTSVEVWGSARQLSLRETLQYGLNTVYAAYEFRFRYETAKNVNNNYTIIYEGRTFESLHITEVNEAKTEIKIVANERTT